MTDYDSIWRTQDEITADYDGIGAKGSKFSFYL